MEDKYGWKQITKESATHLNKLEFEVLCKYYDPKLDTFALERFEAFVSNDGGKPRINGKWNKYTHRDVFYRLIPPYPKIVPTNIT